MKKKVFIKKIFLFFLFSVCINFFVFSQEVLNRKKIALVLSGGGAKGLAQVGIIKAIEEVGIPIDIVIGTSAGALVGGLYASGHSPSQIEHIFSSMNWLEIFSDSFADYYEKYNSFRNREPFLVSLGFTNQFKMEIGNSLLTGQNIFQELKGQTVKIPFLKSFDELPIPFRAVAIELLSSNIAVLDKGDLSEAIRASINLPAVFSPFDIDGTPYIDGGITEHIPVKIAKDLGYDIVIAIDTGDEILTEIDNFNANPIVALNQMINISQAKKNKIEKELATLVIRPPLERYSLADFSYADEILKLGNEYGQKIIPELQNLKNKILVSDKTIEEKTAYKKNNILQKNKIKEYDKLDNFALHEIKISGLQKKDLWLLERLQKYHLQKLDYKIIKEILSQIYSQGNYKQIQARLIPLENETTEKFCDLLIIASSIEKKNNSFNIGLNYASTISESLYGKMQLNSNVCFNDITSSGSSFSIDVSLMDSFKAQVQFFQPMTYDFFVEALLNYENSIDIFLKQAEETILFSSQKQGTRGELATGVFLGSNAWLRINSTYHWLFNNKEKTLNAPISSILTTGLHFKYNSLNQNTFATHGHFVDCDFSVGFPISQITQVTNLPRVTPPEKEDSPIFSKLQVCVKNIFPINDIARFSVTTFLGTDFCQQLTKETATKSFYAFSIPDRIFFPNSTDVETFGNHKFAFAFSFITNPLAPITPIGGEGFFSLNASLGNVWQTYEDINFKNLVWCGTTGLGIRISDSFSLLFRLGAGCENNKIKPFLSIDVGAVQ